MRSLNRIPVCSFLLLSLAATTFVEEVSAEEVEVPEDIVPYVHPLMGSALPGGLVPVLDVKDSAQGLRYAIEEAAFAIDDEEATIVRSSGVVELKQAKLTPEELEKLLEAKVAIDGPPIDFVGPPAKHNAPMLEALATGDPTTPLQVLLRVVEPGGPTLFEDLERAIGRGEVKTVADSRAVRAALLAERQVGIKEAFGKVADAAEELGGTVTYRCQNLHGLTATLTVEQVKKLAERDDVVRLDLVTDAEDDADGLEIIQGMQLEQLIDAGHDGENTGNGRDIIFAMHETTQVADEHPGYQEWVPATPKRIFNRFTCNTSGCTHTSNFTTPGDHATKVSGIIFGDLRDGQDATVTDPTERIRRSGYAGEARGHLYATGRGADRRRPALDHVVARSVPPAVVNASWSSNGDDPECLGDTAFSRDANDLFESGMLLIKSAGNNGNSNTDCLVGAPGSAIGVFTVGGYGQAGQGLSNVRNGSVFNGSSVGGVSFDEGRLRTIIDGMGYACRDFMFRTDGGYGGQGGCATSWATPTVTAAAIDYIDFFKHEISDSIDNPGYLFAQLLMMGDRATGSGKRPARFHRRWGAGRMKMRKLDGPGLDGPWFWSFGSTCVDNGTTVTIPVNFGNTVPGDVDDFKAVAYWYDPAHENGNRVSDVDLRLRKTNGVVLRDSNHSYDNKERVWHDDVGGEDVEIQLIGVNVPTDGTSCGSNSIRVYWFILYEDGDRDDSNGPGTDISPL